MTACSIDGCTDPAHARGWCERHYAYWKRNRKDPALLRRGKAIPLAERAWRYIRRDAVTGCWDWAGTHDRLGYARVGVTGSRSVPAHRALYELLVEPIPDGLVLDHRCRNRGCVNPSHLDVVTQQENVQRGWAAGRTQGRSRGRWSTNTELQGATA